MNEFIERFLFFTFFVGVMQLADTFIYERGYVPFSMLWGAVLGLGIYTVLALLIRSRL